MMMRAIAFLALLVGPMAAMAANLSPADLPTTAAAKTTVLHFATYSESDSIKKVNPFLTKGDLKGIPSGAACATRKPWETCSDYLSLFSGIAVEADTTNGFSFVGLTDRGPNIDCKDFSDFSKTSAEWKTVFDTVVLPESVGALAGQSFPLPKFSPSFFKVQMDTATQKLTVGQSCNLKKTNGAHVSGLGNLVGIDPYPYKATCAAGPIAYNQGGLDTEDIQIVPGRDHFVIVEEYTPSIAIVKGFGAGVSCGEVIARYVPTNSTLNPKKTGYPIFKVLPAALSMRRSNRGMENLAVSADGNTLIAMLQSPLGAKKVTGASPVLMAVRLDITSFTAPKVLGMHVYIEEAAPLMWEVKSEKQDAIKLSGFADAAPTLGLPAGTPVVLALERAVGQIKIFLTDFSVATDVKATVLAEPLKFELLGNHTATVAALAQMGVVPAQKKLVLDTKLISGGSPTIDNWKGNDKQEGVAILNDCVIAMGSDNDFGYLVNESNLSIIQLEKCLSEVNSQ